MFCIIQSILGFYPSIYCTLCRILFAYIVYIIYSYYLYDIKSHLNN